MVQVGDYVKIIANKSDHAFKLGQVVKIVYVNQASKSYTALSGNSYKSKSNSSIITDADFELYFEK